MFRLLGFLSATPRPLPMCVFDAFPGLAWTGRVGPMEAAGHDDGWGIWIRGEDEEVWFRSAATLKEELGRYKELVERYESDPVVAAVCHLRKTSGSPRLLENTQPFVDDGLVFSHNGTVFEPDTLTCSSAPAGDSDSERLFLFIADRVAERGFGDGISDAIASLRRHSWTALNFVLTDGHRLAAYRGYDESRDHIDARQLYYEMYYATVDDGVVVSSEPIDDEELRWVSMSNESLLLAEQGEIELR